MARSQYHSLIERKVEGALPYAGAPNGTMETMEDEIRSVEGDSQGLSWIRFGCSPSQTEGINIEQWACKQLYISILQK